MKAIIAISAVTVLIIAGGLTAFFLLKDNGAAAVVNGTTISIEKVEEEVFIPLYKETYTEGEVKELIAFYKTPVGQKSVQASQKLPQQAAQKSAEKYDSVIGDFVKKEIEENIEIVKNEIKEQGFQ